MKKWLSNIKHYHWDIIRIYVGLTITIKGIDFLLNPGLIMQLTEDNNLLVIESILAHYIVITHLSGGILLTIGLLSRIAAGLQIPILLGAVFFVHYNEGLFGLGQNLEFASIILLLICLITLKGGGDFSLDNYVSKH